MGTKDEEIEQLVGRAEHAVSTLQPELACKFYQRALEQDPNRTAVMDSLGELLVGLGQHEMAKELFEKSTTLDPESSASKWLYLAQLHEGWEAKQSFTRGLEILLAELKSRESKGANAVAAAADKEKEEEQNETAVIKDQICSTYCSIAELYLTDLCFEENAEVACQEALDEALKYDQGSAELTQTLASLRLSQVKGEEAAALMLETFRRLANYEEEKLPALAFRINTAKLLLECGAHVKKCVKLAVHVLEMCKCEDDEDVEVWFLLGVAYFTKAKPDLDMARGHLEYARGLLARMKKEGRDEEMVDGQVKLIEEQLELVKEAQANGGASGEEEEDDDDDEEEEEDGMEEDDEDESEDTKGK